MSEYSDELVGWVAWTKNRQVQVFQRVCAGRTFDRVSVFNRRKQHGS